MSTREMTRPQRHDDNNNSNKDGDAAAAAVDGDFNLAAYIAQIGIYHV